MDVTPLVKEGAQIIQSYANGGFRVSGVFYNGAIIVRAGGTSFWNVESFSDLTADAFQELIDDVANIDVVLIGMGATIQFLPPALKKSLRESGLHIDVMDTGAACRTYNVLMAEGRRVCALLLPVS